MYIHVVTNFSIISNSKERILRQCENALISCFSYNNSFSRYFKNGACREGNNCRYRHVQATRNEASINEAVATSTNGSNIMTCRFFKQGICKFGNQCRFRHSSGTENEAIQTNAIENSVSSQPTTNSLRNK